MICSTLNNLKLVASSSILTPLDSFTHYSSLWEVEEWSTMFFPTSFQFEEENIAVILTKP
jgi:hypothetical protein